MPLPFSSKATDAVTAMTDRRDPTLPAILEFQSPSAAIIHAPIPLAARRVNVIVCSLFAAMVIAMGVIPVDQVVSAPGTVIAKSPNLVVQPLETAMVRSIDVHPGEQVHAGQVLARLDPGFAAADLGASVAQVNHLQAQVVRMQAELNNKPFSYTGLDPDMSLQAAVYAQREAEYDSRLENYQQKSDGLAAAIQRANADADGYGKRLEVAQAVEGMRRQLERLQVGSRLNTLAAQDNSAEMARDLASAGQAAASARRDLAALVAERDGYMQQWHADLADKLADATSKLSDARAQMKKSQLRRALVELRADRDATVLSIAKVSVGSVLQSGQHFITMVPSDAPLEIEADIPAAENGYVHVGDKVAIKFATFPFTRYGLAYGTVRVISPDSFTAQDDARNPTGDVPTSTGSNQPYYRARVSLDRVALRNTPPGFRLMSGMPTTADIKVGHRTVLTYLLERVLPVAYNGMREP